MCPAAKQIELDLLRTLPNNKHYESPHSPGWSLDYILYFYMRGDIKSKTKE